MADPRASTKYEGQGATYLTFAYDSTITFDNTKSGGSSSVGLAVTMTADSKVGLTQDANRVAGKLIEVRTDGFCVVQVRGTMTLPAGNGATVTNNVSIVGALGAASAKGYIRNTAVATLAEVAVAGASVILDASTTTAVAVLL